jgi:hypothetical protein
MSFFKILKRKNKKQFVEGFCPRVTFGGRGGRKKRSMFSTLDKPASMKEMMSILSGARALSKKLNGCTNMCVVGATAGLNVRSPIPTPCHAVALFPSFGLSA